MADIADRASDVIQQNLETSLANRPRWVGIARAAGPCTDCDEPIPAARRQAAPWATRCVDCQSIHEGKAKHVR